MALTGMRWFALATLGCLTLAVVYWPGTAAEDPNEAFRATMVARPHQALQFRSTLENDAGRGLVLLQVRDRILDSLASAQAPKEPVVFQIPLAPGVHTASRLATATESLARILKPSVPLIQTFLVTHPDTSYSLPSAGRVTLWGSWYVMPGATNGRVCLALPRRDDVRRLAEFLFDSSVGVPQDESSALLRTLGPCAFYTAFGSPGPGIEQWLRAQNYATASRADWEHPPARLERPTPDDLPDNPSQLDWMSMWNLLREASSGAFDMGPLNLPARACAHGRLEQCGELLQSPFPDIRPPLGRRYAVAHQWWWARGDLGGAFLSDLVRIEGREPFIRFWRSTLQVDSAFTQAFGVTMEEWTHRWLIGNIEQPRFGPVVRLGSVLFGLVLVGVAVAATGLLTLRRQVG